MQPMKRLTEKGYGSKNFGTATVIASEDGSPVTLNPVVLPVGLAGEMFLQHNKTSNMKSFHYSEGVFYQLVVRRNGDAGTVKVILWDLNNKISHEESNCFSINEQGELTVYADGHLGSQSNKELLNNVLSNAFVAAINRSLDSKPESLYFGNFAQDAVFNKRETPVRVAVKK